MNSPSPYQLIEINDKNESKKVQYFTSRLIDIIFPTFEHPFMVCIREFLLGSLLTYFYLQAINSKCDETHLKTACHLFISIYLVVFCNLIDFVLVKANKIKDSDIKFSSIFARIINIITASSFLIEFYFKETPIECGSVRTFGIIYSKLIIFLVILYFPVVLVRLYFEFAFTHEIPNEYK